MTLTKTMLMAALLLLTGIVPIAAQQIDQAQIEKGQAIYKSRDYECDSCHGWSGRGKPADHAYSHFEYGGNSLVLSEMTRGEMIMMISCGRIVRAVNIMPQYRGDAWTASYPCWGKVTADMPADQRPLRAPSSMLSPGQIELVVDYVQAVYQGKEMTWDWCSRYFDDFQRICEVWMERGFQ